MQDIIFSFCEIAYVDENITQIVDIYGKILQNLSKDLK